MQKSKTKRRSLAKRRCNDVRRNAFAKCEACGRMVKRNNTNGWSQFGISRYDITYDREGLAWYRQHCN
jgi:hypothetical protein